MRKVITVPKRVAVALIVLKDNIDFWSVADLFGIGNKYCWLHLTRFLCFSEKVLQYDNKVSDWKFRWKSIRLGIDELSKLN